MEESEAYWGAVYSFPIVSPLSKPHPTKAQAQTPKPLCAPSLSLFLFLSASFSISLWFFLVTFFYLIIFSLFPPSFCRLNHTHTVPLVCVTLPAVFVSLAAAWTKTTISVFNTGAWRQKTNYSNHRSYKTLTLRFSFQTASLTLCRVIKHVLSDHHLRKPLEHTGL